MEEEILKLQKITIQEENKKKISPDLILGFSFFIVIGIAEISIPTGSIII